MKNFHQNLLIVLALGLCGLCAWQWWEQTLQRRITNDLKDSLAARLADIQRYTNSIQALDGQVAQMGEQINELKGTIKTNGLLILTQKRQLNQLEADNGALTNEIAQYKDAVVTLEGKLKEAYSGIEKQNAAIKDLVSQRDDFVQKLNASVKDRNDIAAKYNDLAAQMEKMESASAKTSAK